MKSLFSKMRIPTLILFFCICLNILGHHIAYDNSYRFLYLDMIGTMIGSLLLGPLWGISIALFTNAVESIKDEPFAYFTVVNVVGAAYWGTITNLGLIRLFSKDGVQTSRNDEYSNATWYMIKVGLLAGVATSVPAAVIQHVVFNFDTGSYSSKVTEVVMTKFTFTDQFWKSIVEYVADMMLSVPDKIITASFGLLTIVSFFRHFAHNLTSDRKPWKFQNNAVSSFEIFVLTVATCTYLGALFVVSKGTQLPGIANKLLDFSSPDTAIMNITLSIPIFILAGYLVKFFIGKKKNGNIADVPLYENYNIQGSTVFWANIIVWILSIACLFAVLFQWVGTSPITYYTNSKPYEPSVFIVFSLLMLLFTIFLIDRLNCSVSAQMALDIADRVKRETEINVLGALAHQLKHKILPARINIADAIDNIRDNNCEAIAGCLENTNMLLSQMDSQIKSIEQLFTDNIQQFEAVNISNLFEKQIVPHHISNKFSIKIDIPKDLEFSLNVPSFVDAMTNLIRNAEMHAFESNSPENCISFKIDIMDGTLAVDYKNNGKPLPPELTQQSFLTYGKKRSNSPGQGIGGAYIDKMVRAHNGSFQIIPSEEPYNIHFRITLSGRSLNEN